MIERVTERPGFQRTNRFKRSRCAGPFHNSDGRREVLGMDIGPSEAETFWTEFLRKLRRRGLRGVKLVISDAHEGIKAAVTKLMNAAWQRYRVGALKNSWPSDSLIFSESPSAGRRHAGAQGTRSTRAVHHRLAAATRS